MLIIPFLILLLFFGLLISVLLRVKVGLIERLSLSYLLGMGLFTFFVFAFDLLFNIDYSIYNTFSLLLSLCAILFAIKYKDIIEFFKSIKFEKRPLKWHSVLFWSFIVLIITYTFVTNVYWPVSDWDALALYDFRAKVFMIDPNLTHAAINNKYFLSYPLLTSLIHLFTYQVGLQNPKFIYSLLYLSFIVIFYSSLNRSVGDKKAILFTIILALVPEIFSHSMMAYTNLAYTVYICTGAFYLYSWYKDKNDFTLILSAVLVGLSSWARASELFGIVLLAAVVIISIKNKKLSSIIYYVFGIFVFRQSWVVFIDYINKLLPPVQGIVPLTYIDALKQVTISQLLIVTGYLYKNVFSTWGLMFVAFIVVSINHIFVNKLRSNLFLKITLSFLVFLFIGTVIFSISYVGWQNIPDSARRMSIFLLPLMLYTIPLLLE